MPSISSVRKQPSETSSQKLKAKLVNMLKSSVIDAAPNQKAHKQKAEQKEHKQKAEQKTHKQKAS